MRSYRGQGATEYLVLLAVVLIVALVSVALLGFFPGMASDAQQTQSQAYWSGASPIAITETTARAISWSSNSSAIYMRIKNNGVYPIRLTAIVGGDDGKAYSFYGGGAGCYSTTRTDHLMRDFYYMGPGEEKYFSYSFGDPCDYGIWGFSTATSGTTIGGAGAICNPTGAPGKLIYKKFGFEYEEYIDGQTITKRESGKDLIITCQPGI